LLAITPKYILILGADIVKKKVKKLYPKAFIVQLDIAYPRLLQAQKAASFFQKESLVCADIHALPFHKPTFDLIIANGTLAWCIDTLQVIKNIAFCLKPEGAFLFTSFGPDTLKEFRSAVNNSFKKKPDATHLQDMHDVGDQLLQASFSDPVVDREELIIYHSNFNDLISDIKQCGASFSFTPTTLHLMTSVSLQNIASLYEKNNTAEGLPCTVEVIYGLAWANHPIKSFDIKLEIQ